jgi:DNA mismatch repair ATPase MutS
MASWGQAAPAGLTTAAAGVFAACALATIAIASLVFAERIGARWLILWLIAEAAITMGWRRRVHLVLGRIASPDRDLALMTELLARIEAERFAAPLLTAIASTLLTEGMPPSRRIAQLRRLISWLDSTRNQLFAPIALALLLPQQLAVAIDRWHARFRTNLMAWLAAVGELEALASLGTYAFEHPSDPFPEIRETAALFVAEGLAHPLMPEPVAVRNDMALGGTVVAGTAETPGNGPSSAPPRVVIISGSNMSGKSTLLRSVGVNAVLALAGAPVRAARLRLSPLAIGATLRVEDSLQAGHSRFYAEILRIRAIVDQARGPVPLLFLLDEILHGTNSYDRRIGAEAIVRALVDAGAIGLVTTHDLALTELTEKLGPAAVNMHFEDRLEQGRMVFDYRMRPGVVEHSNALALMRAVGLEV